MKGPLTMRLFTEMIDAQLAENAEKIDWLHRHKGMIDRVQELREHWESGNEERASSQSFTYSWHSAVYLTPAKSDKAGYDPMVFLEETVDKWDDIEELCDMKQELDGDIKLELKHIPSGWEFKLYFMFSKHCKIVTFTKLEPVTKTIAICS